MNWNLVGIYGWICSKYLSHLHDAHGKGDEGGAHIALGFRVYVCPLIQPILVAGMPTPLHPLYVILSSMLSSPPSPLLPTFFSTKSKVQLSYCKFLFMENSIILGFFFLQFWDIKNSTNFLNFFGKVSWIYNREKYIQTFFEFFCWENNGKNCWKKTRNITI